MPNWWYNKEFVYWPTGTPRQTFLYWMGMLATVMVLLIGVLGISKAYSAPAPDECKVQFFNGQMPDYDSAIWRGNDPSKPPENVITLCYTQFGLQNSSLTKTPLWSAEHLTADRIRLAEALKRKNTFHVEPKIAFVDRATLADYLGSGYDRGHMSPDADMPDALSMHESFSLANMVPQNPCNNEILWAAIEGSVRNYVLAGNDVYVVTGPIFGKIDGKTIVTGVPITGVNDPATIGGSKVWVPAKLFKAVYDPKNNAVTVETTLNTTDQTVTVITPEALFGLTGVDVFPAAKTLNPTVLTLPPLHALSGSCKKGVSGE